MRAVKKTEVIIIAPPKKVVYSGSLCQCREIRFGVARAAPRKRTTRLEQTAEKNFSWETFMN